MAERNHDSDPFNPNDPHNQYEEDIKPDLAEHDLNLTDSDDYHLYTAEEEILNDRRKKIVLIIVLLAALVFGVLLFFGVRACQNSGKDKDNVSFEKKDRLDSQGTSKISGITMPQEETKPSVTVSEQTTRESQAAYLPIPTTIPTTSRQLTIHEEETNETTLEVTEVPSSSTTLEETRTTTSTTPESTSESEEIDEDDDLKWPNVLAPNPKLPEIMEGLKENTVVSADGERQASLTDYNLIEINNQKGEVITIEDLEYPVDKVLAVSNDFVFYQSANKIYRLRTDNKLVEEIAIPNPEFIDNANFKTDLNNNLIFWNEDHLSIIGNEMTESTILSEKAFDVKLQGNLLAFLNEARQIQFMDLTGDLKAEALMMISELDISSYALTTDGSAIYYMIGNSLSIYSSNKHYLISDNAETFLLTSNPEILFVYTNESNLELHRAKDSTKIEHTYKDVNQETMDNNKVLNYNGNYLYANPNEFNLLYKDGESEIIAIP